MLHEHDEGQEIRDALDKLMIEIWKIEKSNRHDMSDRPVIGRARSMLEDIYGLDKKRYRKPVQTEDIIGVIREAEKAEEIDNEQANALQQKTREIMARVASYLEKQKQPTDAKSAENPSSTQQQPQVGGAATAAIAFASPQQAQEEQPAQEAPPATSDHDEPQAPVQSSPLSHAGIFSDNKRTNREDTGENKNTDEGRTSPTSTK